ncbi:hypothetical protein [Paenibacillus polymyxa]|uniref:hypothetical protein n=1 Tax=Paenibacillus polymyxa TaxID=1406 RepID=UPI00287F40A3|nr:hypothetical protein [Paenibacillus polymyxa]
MINKNKADFIVGLAAFGFLGLSMSGIIADPQTILKCIVGLAFLSITLRCIAKYS